MQHRILLLSAALAVAGASSVPWHSADKLPAYHAPDDESSLLEKRKFRPEEIKIKAADKQFTREQSREDAQHEHVDVKVEKLYNGEVKAEYYAHGLTHKLHLVDSGHALHQIPLQLVGQTAEDEELVKRDLADIQLMTDMKTGASIAVKHTAGEDPMIYSGMIHLLGHEIALEGDTEIKGKLKVRKQKLEQIPREMVLTIDNAKQRKKRDLASDTLKPINATVELALILDYSVFSSVPEFFNVSENLNYTSKATMLTVYYVQLVAIMDQHYATMRNDDVHIGVVVSGLIIIGTPELLSELTESHAVYLPEHDVRAVPFINVFNSLTKWLGTSNSSLWLPVYDHVMLFTSYPPYGDVSEVFWLLGVAYIGAICDRKDSTSLLWAVGPTASLATIASHELAHSLGYNHDGESGYDPPTCPNENYIMSPYYDNSFNPDHLYLFSCCTQRTFYYLLQGKNADCLRSTTTNSTWYRQSVDVFRGPPSGVTFDADKQCHMTYGTGSCLDQEFRYNVSVCRVLYCVNPDNTSVCLPAYYDAPAAVGTSCGNNSWCYQGACVERGTTDVIADQQCNVNDCYGDEKKCTDGVNRLTLLPGKCYHQYRECDGVSHCSDGSDEQGCDDVGQVECPADYNKCVNGSNLIADTRVPSYCIPTTSVCNGYRDCTDLSDEENCQCGFESTEKSGLITAPNYPRYYLRTFYCEWRIKVSPGYAIKLTFTDNFYIDAYGGRLSSDLCIDKIMVYDGNSYGFLQTICSEIKRGENYVFYTNSLIVTFQTDNGREYPGWQLSWEEVTPPTPTLTPPNIQTLTEGCIECFMRAFNDLLPQQNCLEYYDAIKYRQGCGNYHLVQSIWRYLAGYDDFSLFLACSSDQVCAHNYIHQLLYSVSDVCESEMYPRKFRTLTCAEYGRIWFAAFAGEREIRETCSRLKRVADHNELKVDMCNSFMPRPPSKYNPTLCETAKDYYGVCQMNDMSCANGTYHDRLCRHPSNTGQVPSKQTSVYRSCCVMHDYTGYDAANN